VPLQAQELAAAALAGNSYFTATHVSPLLLFPVYWVEFTPSVIQFWDDNLADYNGESFFGKLPMWHSGMDFASSQVIQYLGACWYITQVPGLSAILLLHRLAHSLRYNPQMLCRAGNANYLAADLFAQVFRFEQFGLVATTQSRQAESEGRSMLQGQRKGLATLQVGRTLDSRRSL